MKKVEAEYIVNTSPGVLFARLSTASGLAEWFADDVKIDKDGLYHFSWDGEEEVAKLLSKKNGDFVKYHWMHLEDGTFLEFRLKTDPLTRDLALIITYFVEEDEEEEARMLWDNQVEELLHVLGS
ncbi:MAG: hypothetical protein ACJATE_000719 [Bacteroidia bacterium]|jgi:uncharacterized protein YndB with AHSA1/START domain